MGHVGRELSLKAAILGFVDKRVVSRAATRMWPHFGVGDQTELSRAVRIYLVLVAKCYRLKSLDRFARGRHRPDLFLEMPRRKYGYPGVPVT